MLIILNPHEQQHLSYTMATSFQSHVHHSFDPPADSFAYGGRKDPGLAGTWENASWYSTSSSSGAWSGTTALTDLVHSVQPFNNTGIVNPSIIGANHERLLEWIRSERMRKLPPVGSSYDKVLICARLFVERLHSFDRAIRHFAQESHMATQLAYSYCASLLEFGEENADALLDLFNFFYRCSVAMDNLLSRAELFAVSQTIRDQVVLALADLVTLVVGIATHFRKRKPVPVWDGGLSYNHWSVAGGASKSVRRMSAISRPFTL
ncbi:hypothetical protein ASPCAL14804 [Aspergillus calidoustus]|uniref:Uncharacterized protein n=1 Tax=Aspergillus calidoustus TaxID=454130 RepID=A0A0U5CKE1_ASPCI|nr:hypothetical protein ASPCAL14804 [Aspergillus calidoustus]